MGPFEAIKQGLIGLALFAGNWFLPANDDASLSVASITENGASSLRVSVKMEMALSPQLEELIDAGIPLNMKCTSITDKMDTIVVCRTLFCNVASLRYRYADSSKSKTAMSKEYPMILLALKDFCRWDFTVPRGATECRTEIEMLNSHVSQLNRTVDMSRVWGQKRIKTTYVLTGIRGETR